MRRALLTAIAGAVATAGCGGASASHTGTTYAPLAIKSKSPTHHKRKPHTASAGHHRRLTLRRTTPAPIPVRPPAVITTQAPAIVPRTTAPAPAAAPAPPPRPPASTHTSPTITHPPLTKPPSHPKTTSTTPQGY